MLSPPDTLLRSDAELSTLLEAKAERLAHVVSNAGRERIVLGLSGGIDSAVAMGIAARALGPEAVIAVRLPSRHTEQVHLDDAELTAAAVGLPEENLLTISIEPLLAGLARVRPDVTVAASGLGNASARSRMIVIFDVAQESTRWCSAPRTAPRICSGTSPGSATPPRTSSRSPTSTRPRCERRRGCWVCLRL